MKIRILLLLNLIFCTLTISAQQGTSSEQWSDPTMPSVTHDFLKGYDGKWKGEVKMYLDAEGNVLEYEGVAESKMIMDGRYQVTDFTASIDGMAMQGNSILAFDNTTNKFTSTWIDNFGTGMLIMYGVWNEKENNQIDFEGTMVLPENGQEVSVRQEFVFVDENSQSMKLWYDFGEGEFLSMEVQYTRFKVLEK